VVGLGLAHHAAAGEPDKLTIPASRDLAPRPELSLSQQTANTVVEHLQQSGQLHHYTIDVGVENGTAELTGTVADQFQREEALRIVQGVPGVERVLDHLTLASDAGLTQAQAQVPPPAAEPVVPPRRAPAPGSVTEPVPIFQAPPPTPADVNPPSMPPYSWPTYAPYNNFSRVAYPLAYPYQSWPFIGPIYPYPKIPPGWRKVTLEWQDGHWWYGTHSCSHDWWTLRYW
jgi:hypothetical protein